MKFPQFVTTAKLGPTSLVALENALREAQGDDIFTRVVVVADHLDVASAVRHRLGRQNLINVTAQTGERLAAELAIPMLRPLNGDATSDHRTLNRLHESQAVRQVAMDWLTTDGHPSLSEAGARRLFAEFAEAFRQWEQRPVSSGDSSALSSDWEALDLPRLYDNYRDLLERRDFHTRYRLPALAAQALQQGHWPEGAEPAVIYYLPRRPSAGELELMQTLLKRGKCQVIIGLSGDAGADQPAVDLHRLMTGALPDQACNDGTAIQRMAGETLSITVAPDPVEEVRAVVRRITAMSHEIPFHRVAVVHRQEAPYASLVRQELSYAEVPYTGVPRRTLADTGAGRFLLGVLAMASAAGDDTASQVIDRELLIDLLTSAPLGLGKGDDWRPAPGVAWANLARRAHTNGTVQQWTDRLRAMVDKDEERRRELTDGETPRDGQDADRDSASARGRDNADLLIAFLNQLAPRLRELRSPADPPWIQAQKGLKSLLDDFLTRREEQDDRVSVDKLLDSLSELSNWNAGYSLSALQDGIINGLQSQVSDRGKPFGSGVYVGPPAGVIGGDYDTVFVVGMIEGQFPPPHRITAFTRWFDQGSSVEDRDALERYEFFGAVATARKVALSYPAAGADRRAAYPSRWLLEAADLIRQRVCPTTPAVTSENLATHPELAQWRTVILSREGGLRQMSAGAANGLDLAMAPAAPQDYNLMHLLPRAGDALPDHPAWADEPRMKRAVDAVKARRSEELTQWDGLVGPVIPEIAELGDSFNPVSPSSLETWAACPYRYFLQHILHLHAPPSDEDDDEMTPSERGTLVHQILERFVQEGRETVADLLDLAEEEFRRAVALGITGYPLLWEMQKEEINAGLRGFFDAEKEWLQTTPFNSEAEKRFENVVIEVPGLGSVHFHGKIDRIDVLEGEVRVRDFKTGRPGNYEDASANTASQSTVRPAELPAIAQETLDKLRALAAERKDTNDVSDRWYREYLVPAIAVVEQVLQIAHDPAEAKRLLGDGKAITQAGRLRKSDAWPRDLTEVKQDFVQAGSKLLDAVKETAKQAQQTNGNSPRYSVANGRALQLPVYLAAAKQAAKQSDQHKEVTASYCFPLADGEPTHDVGRYDGQDGQDEVFYQTLTHIIDAARGGIFPATPDEGQRGNCHYCDFKQLCPTRRRQFWERKGRQDSRVQAFNALRGSAAIQTKPVENANVD